MKIRFAGLLLGVLLPFCASAQDIKFSVVQIFNQNYQVNYQYPWQNGDINYSSGSGVVIEGGKILTNAHVIDNSLHLQVRLVGSDKKYKAHVEYVSDERDLALVVVDEPEFQEKSRPLKFGKLPRLGDEVTTYGFPVGGSQLAITRGIVSRIDYDQYAHSGYSNLVCQIDAAINAGASGGPAIIGGRIAGLNFQGLNSADNVGYIIPTSVIENFLEDIKDGQIDGVPEIGIVVQPMENEQLRQRYGMKPADSGMLVIKLSGMEQDAGLIKVGDVIMAMDGVPVGNDMTVPSSSGDRVSSNLLISRRQLGEKLTLDILRNGQYLKAEYPLTYTLKDSLVVPGHASNYMPDYIVIGGFVIIEITQDIIRGWDYMPPLIDMMRYQYKSTSGKAPERLLMVTSILPDDVNVGYQDALYGLIKYVNGHEVKNLQDVREALKDESTPFVTMQFHSHDHQVIFDRKNLSVHEKEIAERYGLPTPDAIQGGQVR